MQKYLSEALEAAWAYLGTCANLSLAEISGAKISPSRQKRKKQLDSGCTNNCNLSIYVSVLFSIPAKSGWAIAKILNYSSFQKNMTKVHTQVPTSSNTYSFDAWNFFQCFHVVKSIRIVAVKPFVFTLNFRNANQYKDYPNRYSFERG